MENNLNENQNNYVEQKNDKAKNILIVVLSIIVLLLTTLLVYVAFFRENVKENNNKTNNNNVIDNNKEASNNATKENETVLCESSIDYENGTFKYVLSKDEYNLVVKINDSNNNEIYKNELEDYFKNETYDSDEKNGYCINHKINIYDISSDNINKYIAIEWKNDLIKSYKVFALNGNNISELVDLTEYSTTGYKYKDNGNIIDSYRIVNNSIYVIQNNCSEDKTFKEKRYIFENGKYKVENTNNTNFEAISGNLC